MSLTLPYRWEHALIAATVEAVSKKYPHCYLGRTAIQKLLYFMSVLGVPMRYKFDIHHYGPFCPMIMYDVDWLLADGVIEDLAHDRRYSNYKLGHGWEELQKQYRERLEKHRGKIESVCHALSDLSPETLELIATLDFSYRWIRAGGGKRPWKEEVIKKFKRIKRDRFSDDVISFWYDVLVKAGLIEG